MSSLTLCSYTSFLVQTLTLPFLVLSSLTPHINQLLPLTLCCLPPSCSTPSLHCINQFLYLFLTLTLSSLIFTCTFLALTLSFPLTNSRLFASPQSACTFLALTLSLPFLLQCTDLERLASIGTQWCLVLWTCSMWMPTTALSRTSSAHSEMETPLGKTSYLENAGITYPQEGGQGELLRQREMFHAPLSSSLFLPLCTRELHSQGRVPKAYLDTSEFSTAYMFWLKKSHPSFDPTQPATNACQSCDCFLVILLHIFQLAVQWHLGNEGVGCRCPALDGACSGCHLILLVWTEVWTVACGEVVWSGRHPYRICPCDTCGFAGPEAQ